MTSIEWTRSPDGTPGKTWNPVVGCSRVSAGCEHCYAERVAHRGMTPSHKGLTVMGRKGPRWTGEVRCLPERLEQPLRWRKPRRVFVNSMSDLFHEDVPHEFIAAVFGVMAATPRHTYQILTKRDPRPFFEWLDRQHQRGPCGDVLHPLAAPLHHAQRCLEHPSLRDAGAVLAAGWPLPNVWLGCSVENQETADQRIPWLLECPAAVRWVSYEPALGAVDFSQHLPEFCCSGYDPCTMEGCGCLGQPVGDGLDWIVIGGESGPGARLFDLAWARSTIAQCRAAGVPCFTKQLGANPKEYASDLRSSEGHRERDMLDLMRRPRPPHMEGWTRITTADRTWWERPLRLRDRKGGDMSEWPEDLRVREYPRGVL